MENKINVKFSSVPQLIADSIPDSTERKSSTYISYGIKNDYPNFLYDSYSKCPSLQTIINGYADYVVGDGIIGNVLSKPNPSESWAELYVHLAADYVLYGNCFLQVIRNVKNEPVEIYWLDAMYVRTDKNNESFYYNENFGKNYVKSSDTIVYPKFKRDLVQPSSVVMIKTPLSKSTYGNPIWHSALKSVMTEISIDDFHMREIENNFFGSAIINFSNGIPSEEEQEIIEKMVNKKFSGSQNAGRFLLSFNNGVDNKTTVERLGTDDFDKRYESLAKKTQKQIFTAFGVSPVVFGVLEEGKGFSDQDFVSSFKLFNRTRIYPIQTRINDVFDKIFGVENSMTIKPFTIDFTEEGTEDKEDVVK